MSRSMVHAPVWSLRCMGPALDGMCRLSCRFSGAVGGVFATRLDLRKQLLPQCIDPPPTVLLVVHLCQPTERILLLHLVP